MPRHCSKLETRENTNSEHFTAGKKLMTGCFKMWRRTESMQFSGPDKSYIHNVRNLGICNDHNYDILGMLSYSPLEIM